MAGSGMKTTPWPSNSLILDSEFWILDSFPLERHLHPAKPGAAEGSIPEHFLVLLVKKVFQPAKKCNILINVLRGIKVHEGVKGIERTWKQSGQTPRIPYSILLMQTTLNPAQPPDILIVDDSPSTLQLLSEIFKNAGYSTRAALSGRLALQSLRASIPDLVLLDITMPDISGYDICRAMKADESLKDIPVIFISGHSQNRDVVKGFSAGGVDFVAKPFEISEVVARVKTHLELRQQQQALQKSYAELRSLEEMRDNLVHMIVHDLRNPLWSANIHLEQIQGLADTSLNPLIQNHVNEALAATHTLMEMINSILDVNRMEAGLIPLNPEPFDLILLIQDILQASFPLIKSRRLAIESEAESVVVEADPVLIRRVIHNLLSNAISFTPETGGEIHFGISRHDGMARVTVRDNGQGIPAGYHEKIFEKFYQINSVLNGGRHSTGLGLTFCKLAVEAHGGQIGVQSEEKKGSLFWFDLPENSAPDPRPGESA